MSGIASESAPGCEPSPRARKRATAGGVCDTRAIAARVRRLVAAWNRGDAHAFGDAFAPSATYVTGVGRTVRGRAAIADLVKQVPGRVRIVGEVEVHRRRGVVQARFGWRAPGPRSSARSGVITCTLAREGTSWRIRRLANEERPARPARPSKTG